MVLVQEAQGAGACLRPVCEILGLDVRTVQRWRARNTGDDMRLGPKTTPKNQLSEFERARILSTANSLEYRDLSPKQIVPRLADKGEFIGSESSFYRVLRAEDLQNHRGPKRAPSAKKPREKKADGPCQVWSWDITYLRSPVTGFFFYLYLVVDVWSRKIVAAEVFDRECGELASKLIADAFHAEGAPVGLCLHQDNGAPMKAATLKATLEHLTVLASYSRPHVSDDNPYSESLFGTAKTRPEYPRRPFQTLEHARVWAEDFVLWYNETHLHSGIGFVTPMDRHQGKADEILAHRRAVYAAARRRNPQRWARAERRWEAPDVVYLNPTKETLRKIAA